MTRAAALLVLGLALCGVAAAKGPNPSLFAYDASRPLDVRVVRQETYAARHRFLTFEAGYGSG